MWLDDDDRMGYHHRHLHETRHYQQPNNQPKKHDATTTTTIYSRYTFMMIPLSFEKDVMSFVFFGWMDGERERKRELYNVDKINLENPT